LAQVFLLGRLRALRHLLLAHRQVHVVVDCVAWRRY
jgi:hypothetical protein